MASAESGQFRKEIDTKAKAVMLPIPWDTIKAGGTIIDKGLTVEPKINLIACTEKSREIIKMICLEVITGFSFLEINIKIPQLTKTSAKVKNQLKITDGAKGVNNKIL